MKILIIDDEKNQVELLEGFLKKQGYTVYPFTSPAKAIEKIKSEYIELVISDYKMPEITGEELFKKVKNINPEICFIMLTAFGTIETAVNIMKLGAIDFMEKPVNLKKLTEKIEEIGENIIIEKSLKEIKEKIDINIPFKNENIKNIYKTIHKIANSDINVLITGESGTGKEVIAKTIHKISKRTSKPFIAVNCAAIPENLFESEFFGHEKGAFTGAISQKKGKFELANQGTIFLDEIGEIPLYLQGKLLRVLQERKVERVGGEKIINIDIRVISATNKDLREMVEKNMFREDLFFRLNVIEINLPPLRKRREDIPIFIEFFLKKFSNNSVKISPEAKDLLIKYHFPGNIRELENIIQRAVALCEKNIIQPNDLPRQVRLSDLIITDPNVTISLTETLEKLEKNLILKALCDNNQNKSQAAKSLGINERVIRYKIKKYNLQ